MKLFLSIILLFNCLSYSGAQDQKNHFPEANLDVKEIKAQLEFLASDFLQGRRTGSPGNEIAAQFIAAHLKAYGYDTATGQDHYFQDVPLILSSPPSRSSLTINGNEFIQRTDFLILSGASSKMTGELVFAGHGWVDKDTDHDDYADLDVKGKIVFVLAGAPDAKDPGAIFQAMSTKKKLAKEHGAIALFELYQLPFPWAMFTNYFGGESMRINEGEEKNEDDILYGWFNKTDAVSFETIQSGEKMEVSIESNGGVKKLILSSNVMGVLPGTDPELADEYLLLTAHFDHVGVGAQGGHYTKEDSIFNGARDNGIGVVALLAAAKSFAEQGTARSIIILAVTGEELGLLGSQYYSDHPLIPLEKTIFNLNTDGAGYTDTTSVAVVGWDRTGTNDYMIQGSAFAGLNVIKDPVPEMQLFDRSDNVSFAKKGVPCISFSPGFSEFSDELMKNYHQVSDDTDDLDFEYITKYCQAFTHAARLIANAKQKPQWVSGDKYEAVSEELYGEE